MGRRQADSVGVDAGRAPVRAGLRAIPQNSASQRSGDHSVHGRRLRQQVRARCAGHHLRATGKDGQGSGEADARSQGRAFGHRQPSIGHGEDPRWRFSGWDADALRRAEAGAPGAPAPRPISHCPTSTIFRTASGSTPTSTSTPASNARCVRQAILRAATSQKS